MSCRIYINDFNWCGQFWYGSILKCLDCERQDDEKELRRLQKIKLQKEISALDNKENND